MFDLPHVASRLYGTPLLVARPKLEIILQALGPRLTGEPLAATDSAPAERGQLRITEAGIAVLPIMGTLVRRSSYLSAASGLTSYHDIEADAQEAFTSPDVYGVLLEIDSCGGEAGGLFDLVDALRDMAKSTGKPLWAVADEAALSAATRGSRGPTPLPVLPTRFSYRARRRWVRWAWWPCMLMSPQQMHRPGLPTPTFMPVPARWTATRTNPCRRTSNLGFRPMWTFCTVNLFRWWPNAASAPQK